MSKEGIIFLAMPEQEIRNAMLGESIAVDDWGDIVTASGITKVSSLSFTPEAQRDLVLLSMHLADWLGSSKECVFVFDNSNSFRVHEWAFLLGVIGANIDQSEAASSRGIRIHSSSARYFRKLQFVVSFVLFYVLHLEGHVSLVSADTNYDRWVSIDDGSVTLCWFDGGFNSNFYENAAKLISENPAFYPRSNDVLGRGF